MLQSLSLQNLSRKAAFSVAVTGVALVGMIDYATGVEIRVFPLYFIPLVYAAWYVEKGKVWLLSALATVAWALAMYLGGRVYSHGYIWIINFCTQGTAFAVVAVLFYRLHEALQRERDLSRTDALTGISNARSFHEKLAVVLPIFNRTTQPVVLAYVDLDNFKRANDTLGHDHGDAILRQVASVFKKNLRSSDISARMGGDEFAILLPETTQHDAIKVLDKIRHHLEQEPALRSCNVTASIGAISYLSAPADAGEAIKAADEVMYKVKKGSKNQVLVESATVVG